MARPLRTVAPRSPASRDATRGSKGDVAERRKISVTVAKAFGIVEALAPETDRGLTLADLSLRVALPKSTVHRYLTTLVELGLAQRSDSDRFRLGTKVVELAGIYLAGSDLRQECQSVLDALSERTNETVHLAVRSEAEVVYIAKVESRHAVRMYSYIGARLPMYSTALGKAMLAFGPADWLRETVARGLVARTAHTIANAAALEADLATIRGRGYSLDNEENELGVRCVGAPVFDFSRSVIAAISLSGPTDRMDRKRSSELGPVVRDAALSISTRMGYVA
jgi:IclR family acetate operon transcriptional repressor